MQTRFLILSSIVLSFVAQAEQKPNVLLVAVDDLKPALGCYGDALAHTPNLDRLAGMGMRFDLAYCNQAVCAPSRNNLLVGIRSTSSGVYSLGKNFRTALPNAVTLPQYFLTHGYETSAIGKIFHTGHGNHDDAASWALPSMGEKVVEYLDPASTEGGKLTREEAFFTNQKLGNIIDLPRGAAWESLEVDDSAYADGRIANAAIRRLNEARDKPFFMAVGFVKPHLPFTAPKKYWDMHDPAKIALATVKGPPAGAPAYAGKTLGELNNYSPVPAEPPLTEEMQRKLIQGYYASVSYADAQIGRLLDALQQSKHAHNTIIVLWGDHGWHLGDHGMWTKHTNYEQANHIAFMIVAPGVTQPGSSSRQLVESVDVYPTLVELAGLPAPKVPQGLDGTSLVPVLRDGAARVRDHAYHAFPRQRGKQQVIGRAVRTERYRLVEWKKPGAPPDTGDLELYDYVQDPLETKNLATELPKVVKELRDILASHPEAKP